MTTGNFIRKTAALSMALLGVALGVSACSVEAYCFDCVEGQGGSSNGGSSGGGSAGTGGSGVDIGGGSSGESGSAGTGGGPEDCDADLNTSPSNCGACGNVCPSVPGGFPTCKNGACVFGACADGYVDVDKKLDNGCECRLTGDEICDGIDNDCDGQIDEGFDLDSDPKNCGGCNVACAPVADATVTCEQGKCVVKCDAGHADTGSSGKTCAYTCPVMPPTAETCNGVDDDCDGVIDNGKPGEGVVCETNCPGGQCKGECKPGTTLCTGTSAGLLCVGGVGPSGELCDGKDNDCDGEIDNGFDLQNDPLNCGTCGTTCAASDKCINGKCQFSCAVGYADVDKNPANGCEYKCPVYPPTAETCDGEDNDCNGLVDDNVPGTGTLCSNNCPAPNPCVAAGTCSFPTSTCTNGCCGACSEGQTACIVGQIVCQGGGGQGLEVCDGKDNNCDGQIDEGFDKQNDPLNCGGCGNVCTTVNGIGGCQNGHCTVSTCKPGFADVDGNVANGCEYTCPVYPPTTETCNGKDDDCDGQIDEAVVQPANFCIQTSICVGSKPVCQGTKGWVCNYQQVNANIELDANGNLAAAESLCDGIDNNCNTQIDETFPTKGQSCSVGVGACAGVSVFSCSADKKSVVCPATANPSKAKDELCNGLDDNCDGQIDERTPQGNPQCGGVACKGYIEPMVKVGSTWIYQYEASHPGATVSSVGTDTSRACSVAGALPWTSVNQAQAAAACAAVKDSAGQAMRLCTQAEWEAACAAGGTVNQSIWSYASNKTTYSGTTCNGYDRGLGTAWATGTGASCYANNSGGKVYDMSGNVSEWTSTTLTAGGATYYKVRGGNYDSASVGTSCGFDFVVQQQSFAYPDLGFRCCSNNAPLITAPERRGNVHRALAAIVLSTGGCEGARLFAAPRVAAAQAQGRLTFAHAPLRSGPHGPARFIFDGSRGARASEEENANVRSSCLEGVQRPIIRWCHGLLGRLWRRGGQRAGALR